MRKVTEPIDFSAVTGRIATRSALGARMATASDVLEKADELTGVLRTMRDNGEFSNYYDMLKALHRAVVAARDDFSSKNPGGSSKPSFRGIVIDCQAALDDARSTTPGQASMTRLANWISHAEASLKRG